ncbi:MAG: hypothetical protein LJE75_05215 [Gammaproteobacteria bacterium]|jgi:hypothetical protein|nr:hypothetical protein [Gammaproteobacteria bacterium]
MQYFQTPALYFEGHRTVWRTVKFLTVALAGLLAVIEHSPGLLILLAIAFVMVLALTERIRKLQGMSHLTVQDSTSRLLGDGGSFPGAEPEEEQPVSEAPSVLDGGSL